MRLPLLLAAALALAPSTQAQWDILDTHTAADFRGVDNVGKGIVWISGSNGTILRSEDAGYLWQTCAIPPGAEKLDFRGVQAFDENTAIVMSSGPGDQSRLYKTTDGCQSWKLVFTNPDKAGFWDSFVAHIAEPFDKQTCSSATPVITGAIFGDPTIHKSNQWDTTTHASFYLATFSINSSCLPDAISPSATVLFSGPGEAAFAASNSVLHQLGPTTFWMATDREIIQYEYGQTSPSHYDAGIVCGVDVPLQRGKASQGVFSFAILPGSIEKPKAIKFGHNFHCLKVDVVAVGGNYSAPDVAEGTAAFTGGGNTFRAATTPPRGYRSAVAFDAPTKTWITVGPNGTDISTDDGRNWHPLKPGPSEPPDADQHWNALALPFVVGPHGRVGMLRPSALKPPPGH